MSRLRSIKEWRDIQKAESSEVPSLNELNVEGWMEISGIGPTLAGRLSESTPFLNIDELKQVKGVHRKVFESIQNWFDSSCCDKKTK